MTAPDPALLEGCRSGSRDEVLAALRTFRQLYLAGGPPPADLATVIAACNEGLVDGRGDAAVAIVMFLFDVLVYVPPGLRAATTGPAAPVVEALAGATPRLLALRDSADPLLAAWAWHLLSWMPRSAPDLAGEALVQLPRPNRALVRIAMAFAAASTPEAKPRAIALLADWLARSGEDRDLAAMVLAHLGSHPQHPELTSDAHHAALLELADRGRWDDWQATPSCEHGYFVDLAEALVRAGYSRAAQTLPALLRIVDACSPAELDRVLDLFLRATYQAKPYEGDATLEALDETQRRALEGLLRRPRAWAPRPAFYEALQGLGLPLGAEPMARFLGVAPPAEDHVEVTSVGDGVLVVKTDKTPIELVHQLKRG